MYILNAGSGSKAIRLVPMMVGRKSLRREKQALQASRPKDSRVSYDVLLRISFQSGIIHQEATRVKITSWRFSFKKKINLGKAADP